jgi:tRNA A-37 threonylcarbamoyl transferase component Bud32
MYAAKYQSRAQIMAVSQELSDESQWAALAAQATDRIQRAAVGTELVWIKSIDVKKLHLGHYLQSLLSIGLPGTVFRPATLERGEDAAKGEAARMAAFAKAGFPVPDVLYQEKSKLILSDCGDSIQEMLSALRQAGDEDRHDALLVAIAESMGRVHAAGLVHGRPHPRDMFVRDNAVGYLDFEQTPLRVMKLDRAQARDALFIFAFICDMAKRGNTAERAFAAWSANAPDDAKKQLSRAISQMKPLIIVGSWVSRIKLGADLRRFLAGTKFLLMMLQIDL